MTGHEQYDEGNGDHQEPFIGVSEWQEWNDPTGTLSVLFERDLEQAEGVGNV